MLKLTRTGPKVAYRNKPGRKSYGSDEYTETALVMDAKYAGTCGVCKKRFPVGEQIIYNKISKGTYHKSC